ncbi:MAG: histidine-type phosphatase [Acidobacteriia bacterium]|nr:histidine-type phosphatase [Terriglobia bacterium]
MRIFCLLLTASCFRIEGPRLYAQAPSPGSAKLQFVAVLSRHGVRTPLWTADQLNVYSTEPWPQWDVPLGYLTKHGETLMRLMGAYDREYLTKAGLLGSDGCADAGRFYFWSDTAQRDIETGRAIASGMLPGCAVTIHSVAKGASDPLFSPFAAGVGKPDPELGAAAISGRIGGHPQALVATYRAGLEALQQVLLGCEPAKPCPPEGKSVKKPLLEQPSSVLPQARGLAQLNGPLAAASTIAESLLLEYTDGKKDQEVGWGRLNRTNLQNILLLQDAYVDLALRTPYIARSYGSNLMSHMLKSMQQAVHGNAVAGALGKPGDKGLIVLGHDSNISDLGGMLRISWLLEGYQPNSRPPGGALVFEVWGDAAGKRTVRTYIMSQTLDQMRNAVPLSLATPPVKAAIFVPGCSTAGEGWPCDWDAFERVVSSAIDPAFVSPAAPVAGTATPVQK